MNSDGDVQNWHEITTRIKLGDPQAFQVYYESHFNLMFSAAKRLSNFDEHRAMDIVQDSMLKAIRFMKPFANPNELRSWSVAVVSSVVYDHLRSEASRRKRERSVSIDSAATETEDTLQADRIDWIESQLQELPASQRELIELRYRLGWSLARIAQYLGLRTGAVDGRIRRTLDHIANKATDADE